MTVAGGQGSSWTQLSPELWGIFSILGPTEWDFVVSEMKASLQQLYELQRVCKKFKDVLTQRPQLCKTLLVACKLEGQDFADMLTWIKQHRDNTKWLVATVGSPWAEAALAAVHASAIPVLQNVCMSEVAQAVPHLLAQLASITSCDLYLKPESELSLQPLSALSQLNTLLLAHGRVQDLDATMYLTSLSVRACEAACSQDFQGVTSLKILDVDGACITNFHIQGLAACCNLERLDRTNAWIGDSDFAEGFGCQDNRNLTVPANLTALTGLILDWADERAHSTVMQLDWLSQLTALRHFWAEFQVRQKVLFPAELSALKCLSRMAFVNRTSEASFQFDWKALTSLVKLHIEGPAKVDRNLIGLATVGSLQCEVLHELASTYTQIIDVVSTFAHRLGVERPDVQLFMFKN